ncbi:MAG TPA: shikimate kinase [Candidatus Bariatricus faecipullorum]|nr:shikimate kinase [Candidatus Bariatricus faecipullorum]
MAQENIFLTGFMGAGKSTVAGCFHSRYGREMIEMDQVITEREGMSIPQIFDRYGENYFRQCETKLLKDLQKQEGMVVSCGGGVILREENVREMKKSGRIVYLAATPETILERVKDSEDRPLLKGKKNVADIQELMNQRKEKYEAAADIIVRTDGKTAENICMEILENLKKTGENHV